MWVGGVIGLWKGSQEHPRPLFLHHHHHHHHPQTPPPPSQDGQDAHTIPRFYFPGGKPVTEEVRAAVHAAVQRITDQHPDGLPILALRVLLKEVWVFVCIICCVNCCGWCERVCWRVCVGVFVCLCGHVHPHADPLHPHPPHPHHPFPPTLQVYELPTYLAYPLFYKLVQPGESVVRPRALLDWCDAHNLMGVSEVQRMFEILRGDDRRPFLVQEDFASMMNGILLNHPGLEFLQETPEFQERYVWEQ